MPDDDSSPLSWQQEKAANKTTDNHRQESHEEFHSNVLVKHTQLMIDLTWQCDCNVSLFLTVRCQWLSNIPHQHYQCFVGIGIARVFFYGLIYGLTEIRGK